ncbi:MAG: mg2 transporter protein CorA family protein magnesium transporter [Candidatus Saccharibacteria bacterium]|nr:mg2 transporter protein CorA family protein magnesium transporter [Candidatus Saccharibacteria bacterium]
MQTIYYRSIRQAYIGQIDDIKRGSWLHVVNPTGEELDELAQRFSFDADLLNDGIDLYESPRLEHEDGVTYLYIRYSWPESLETSTQPLLIIATSENLVTVSRRSPEPIEHLVSLGEVVTTQKVKLILQILNQVNNGYRRDLNQITKQIYASRSRLQRKIVSDDDIIRFIDLEEDLNEFLTALQPYGLLLRALASGRYVNFHEDDLNLIEDIELSTNELIDLSKNRLKTIQNMREAYATIAANNLNRIFKRLTSITIFLAVPTVIGGLFGMNVPVPLHDTPYAFWIVCVLIAALVAGTVAYFKRRRWL